MLRREAERVGLDWARLKRDMEDPSIQRRIEANTQLAQALQIQGTPAMVVGETLVPGAVDLAVAGAAGRGGTDDGRAVTLFLCTGCWTQ